MNLVPEPRGYRGYRGMEESRYRVASRVNERNREGSESEENNIEEEEKSGVAYMQRYVVVISVQGYPESEGNGH